MFFIVEQFSPAFVMQANAAHESACPVIGLSRTFFILEQQRSKYILLLEYADNAV